MRRPTDTLRDEHTLILSALDTLERAAGRLTAGHELPDGWWPDLLDWLRRFADRNHHAKEEQSLFPALVKAGLPSKGGPIDVMLEEHEQGRALIRTMAEGAPAARVPAARGYVQLLRAHIDKENGVLFPLAEGVLDEPAQRALQREFDAIEAGGGTEAALAHARVEVERLAAALAT